MRSGTDKTRVTASRKASSAASPRGLNARQLARILNSVPHVIWSAGPDGKPDFISDQWVRNYGGDTKYPLGDGWIALVHPEDVEQAVGRWQAALGKADPFDSQFRLRLPSGAYRWTQIAAKPELDDQGAIVRWYGTCTDIQDRVEAQNALAVEQSLYRSVLQASGDCIKIVRTDGTLELINRSGCELLEIADPALVCGQPSWNTWPEQMRPTVKDAIARAGRGETVRFSGCCPTTSGKVKWWDVVVTPIREDDGSVQRILSISRDCTRERERSDELLWASEHDALTGLPNRRAFQARLQAAALRSMNSKTKVGLLLIDVDHFKHVNDTMGHAAGDALLKEFARRLRMTLRNDDFVGRIGGDEFAIIVEGIESRGDLLAIGNQAVGILRAPVRQQGRSVRGSASIGGAIFPDDSGNANDLFKTADTALYVLKNEGRGGTMLFHPEMRVKSQRIASQLTLARTVVNERSIVPVYQPKVRLATGKLHGFEALLRWYDPKLGLQLPESIEEAFKDYELASAIGEMMQNKVLLDIRRWLDRSESFGCISINAAPAEFLRDDYAERLLERLRNHEVSPHLIEIEVTEHVLMENGSKYVGRALGELKKAGVSIALDDFGTGYSSLSHLRDFPVDIVKIDRSFVQAMTSDPEIASIVHAVVSLGKSLNIRSVAEGIETEEQAKLLLTFGCEFGQGFLIGKAVPADIAVSAVPRSAAA